MKVTIIGIVTVLMFALLLPNVKAQPYFNVYPTEGNANTEIFLQIRGLPGTGFYEYYYLYLFWDGVLLGVFPDNSGTYQHYFDTYFYPPNTGNYSALGNHTIYFEVWNRDRTAMHINASFVFTIIEYLPCDEFMALNVTYYQLLGDFKALNTSFWNLMYQHDALNTEFSNLQTQYTTLLGNYNSLSTNFDALSLTYDALSLTYNALSLNCNEINTAYDELSANYLDLSSMYFNLTTKYQNLSSTNSQLQNSYNELSEYYDALQSVFNSLALNSVQLQGNYTQQVSSYSDLQTNYNDLSIELVNYRNLAYGLIVTTIAFLATTIYLVRRKPKV